MLVAGALALLIFVVAAIVSLLALDLGRTEHRHWLDALKSWQQLIGAVLGFLGAAGVLVLSTAIQDNSEQLRSQRAAHAIGLGLAFEVQTMGVGLKSAAQVGHQYQSLPDPGVKCGSYAGGLRQAMVTATPVYNAVLPRMVDFGDENLHSFVTFYALYADLVRATADMIDHQDCQDTANAQYFLAYLVSKVDVLMSYYAEVAAVYGISPPEAGNPPAEASSEPSPASQPG